MKNVIHLRFGRSLDRHLNNPTRLRDLTREELLAEVQRLREENARLRTDLALATTPDE